MRTDPTFRKTEEDWRDAIADALATDGPYSHNIVSLSLNAIAARFGRAAANRAIDDFNLGDLGWRKAPEDEGSER